MKEGIYHGNCIEFMNEIDNNSIDACITDPPYGISFQSNRTDIKKPVIENDNYPYIDWIKPLYDKLKVGGRLICFYRWDVQEYFLNAIKEAGFTVKSQIVWDKVIHGMGDLNGEFAPQHELMIYATKGRYEFTNNRPKTVYRIKRMNSNEMIHPNEKPVNLLAAIIRDITNKEDLIIDLFGGSFSTYQAAKQENRKCLSFELSEYYYQLGSKRILEGFMPSIFSYA